MRNLGEKSQNTLRSTSYSKEKDQVLCHVYIDVSQDSIIDTNQSGFQFWSCIETEYHKALPDHSLKYDREDLYNLKCK